MIRPMSIRVTLVGNPTDIQQLRVLVKEILAAVLPGSAKTDVLSSETTEGAETNVKLLVVLGALGLVLVGGVIFIVKRSGGKEGPASSVYQQPPNAPPTFDPPPPAPKKDIPPWEQ